MPGRPGQTRSPGSFAFQTQRPLAERSALFDAFRSFATEQDWLPAIAREIELILEEWVTDVVSYGLIHAPAPFLRVEISTTADLAQIVVIDNGIPFDPTLQPEPDLALPVEERPIGGLGIFMMRKLSAAMRYQRVAERNVLTIEKGLFIPSLKH